MATALEGFLHSVKGVAVPLEDAASSLRNLRGAAEALEGFDSLKSGFLNLDLVARDGEILANDIRLSSVSDLLLSGKLSEFFESLGSTHVINGAEESAFRNSVSTRIPEPSISQVADLSNQISLREPTLTTRVNEFSSADAFRDSMGADTLGKVERFGNNLYSIVGKVTKLSLLLGLTALTGFIFHDLWVAAQQRIGCRLIITRNGITTGCKIPRLSCAHPEEVEACEDDHGVRDNIYIYLKSIINHNLVSAKEEVAEYLGTSVNQITDANLENLLKQFTEKLTLFYHEHNKGHVQLPCTETNSSGICIACDPNAEKTSINYAATQLPSNIRLKCVTSITIADLISEFAHKVDGVMQNVLGFSFFSNLKYVALGAVVFVILFALISLFK